MNSGYHIQTEGYAEVRREAEPLYCIYEGGDDERTGEPCELIGIKKLHISTDQMTWHPMNAYEVRFRDGTTVFVAADRFDHKDFLTAGEIEKKRSRLTDQADRLGRIFRSQSAD